MPVRGIRGATTAESNTPQAILQATRELLAAILEANPSLIVEDIASATFTVTDDLNSAYPAAAAREMGWQNIPMLCGREISVPDSLPRCIRVLLHWNTGLPQNEVRHVYRGEAASLRPDLSVDA